MEGRRVVRMVVKTNQGGLEAGVEIRIAAIDDLAAYTNLLQQTYESAYVDDELGLTKECFSKEVFATEGTQEYLKSHLVDTDNQKTWLAFAGVTLVGAITCVVRESEAELTGFYVDPEFQGKGIGKRLYELALKFAGKREVVLDIYAHNRRTIEMYRKWGFELDKSRGDNGYFYRHWDEWPQELQARCMYMRRGVVGEG